MNPWAEVKALHSTDKNVTKYVFTGESAVAEAVLYKYPTFLDRTVVCCSTQSGCPVGCRFCGAGDNFIRSLSSEEIVSQPQHCLTDTGVNPLQIKKLQIMFMSMGEPLLNSKALSPALDKLHQMYPQAALLISTSAPDVDYRWLIEQSKRIATIGLQFSVHASTDAARDKIIPFKHKLNLSQIADRGEEWHQATGRSPFFNYCVGPENSSDTDVENLFGLFNPSVWNATLSVICERDESVACANDRQRQLAVDFAAKLAAKGYNTRVFNPGGQDDVGGGCGQLWHVQNWIRRHQNLIKPSCGEGLPKIHTTKAEELS